MAEQKNLSPVEKIKTASDALRGTLADSLVDELTGAVREHDHALIKFHGMYEQDDRDLREERASQKLDKTEMPDWKKGAPVHAEGNGYVQRVDDKQLMKTACRLDAVIRINRRPGEFVTTNSAIVTVYPPEAVTEKTESHLRDCFAFGPYRTPHQDAAYPLQQLVEIAAHALSPGINEPFTALTCIDWLGASLRSIAERSLPLSYRRDKNGALRVVAETITFDEIADTAFNQIRIYGSSNPAVVERLFETIKDLAPHLHRENDRKILIHHANLIREEAQQISNPHDLEMLTLRHSETLGALAEEV